MALDGLFFRLYFKSIAGRRVFYPYGRVGPGYLVSSAFQLRIEGFLRRWALSAMLTILGVSGLQRFLDLSDALMVAGGLLGTHMAIYLGRMAWFARRLKITPVQLDASSPR